ncbi:lipopolysaccharide-induced tumor necrosis factor-alpha factor isoform X2 [Apteryx rowi]|uniref:lipopolysaccharide-induced tumor necrosis factor-alpha factor isoform X2 n=1 Tax=Apteryx rowi TaxID=308060 RepID=UPI000E1C99A2|nr:lipopolysaccharide-induced tumor necrosis factor-alpha factor isoform X2 [Apteryx rowi]
MLVITVNHMYQEEKGTKPESLQELGQCSSSMRKDKFTAYAKHTVVLARLSMWNCRSEADAAHFRRLKFYQGIIAKSYQLKILPVQ